jgi:hypothetical protein
MLTDERISELLELAADSFEVPEFAVDKIVASTAKPAVSPVFAQLRRQHRIRVAGTSFGIACFVAVLIAAAVSLGGGSNNGVSDSAASSSGSTAAPEQRSAAGAYAPSGSTGSQGTSSKVAPEPGQAVTGTSGGSSTTNSTAAPRVVQTGSAQLQVRVGQVQPALDKLTALANQLGGLVAGSNINADSGPGGSASASITLRVPVAQWSTLQSRLPGIGKVVSSSSSAKDMSGDYVDLVARLNALHTQLNTYETILSKATTTGDVVSVQQHIDNVQSQIEQLEGQRQLLANQSDLATMNVALSEQGAAVTVPPTSNDSGLGGAVHRAWHHFTSGIEWVVAASGTVALILIAVTVIAVGGRVGYRLVRRRLV